MLGHVSAQRVGTSRLTPREDRVRADIQPKPFMKTHIVKCIGTAATAVALGAIGPAAWAQSATGNDRSTEPPRASSAAVRTSSTELQPQMPKSVDDIIGKPVRGSDGSELGQIRDLVIDARSGQVTYAIVSSGGVVGIGGARRAVPFAALSGEASQNGMTLSIDRARWQGAPAFREDQLTTLAQQSQGQAIYQYYGQTWDSPSVAGSTSDQTATERVGGSSAATRQAAIGGTLILASRLEGKDIHNAEREVGEIEDVLVDLTRRTASVLVELEDDFSATEESYVVPFSQLAVTGNGNDLQVTTQLSPTDFQASSSTGSSTMITTDRPYAWRNATARTGGTYAAANRSSGASVSADGTPSKRETTRSSTAPISGGVHTAGQGTPTDSMGTDVSTSGSTPMERASSARVAGTGAASDRDVRYSDATANPQNRPTSAQANTTSTSASASATTPAHEQDVRYSSATANPQNRPTQPASEAAARAGTTVVQGAQASADAVRQALRQDATLRNSTDGVAVSIRGDSIVLSGSVPSREIRDRVVQTARSVATGQRVDDQIRVIGAAE
jgi:sporulation protein YlmC with PRC-barrel domain